jgi:NAD(P)-dependent dehydrogenase (short-subunit alcohol dehydrogenase family)
VVYFEADGRDAAAVRAAVAAVRRDYGPIRGLVHGAGILADRLIEEKTDEQFETVYSTKVVALRTLLDALGSDDLRALVLFSSSTARFGRKGQADYAAANEVLNKMARSEAARRPRCRVLSVNWGPWAGGMVTPALAHVFEEEGIGLIEPAAGGDYLVRELAGASPESPVEVVVLGGGTDLARLSASLGNGLQNVAQPPSAVAPHQDVAQSPPAVVPHQDVAQSPPAVAPHQDVAQSPPAVVPHRDVAQPPPAVNPSTTELPKSSGSIAKAGSSASARSIVPEEPAPSDPSLTLAIEHGVSLAEMPVLASHVLDGRAVLPAALMVELLAHGAMHANPGLRFRGLADFRVFKGILLGPQDRCTAQVWTRRAVKGDGEFAALAELRSTGENGKPLLHARAEVLLGSASPRATAPMALPAGLAPWPAGRPFYGPDLLFHGPDMQAIQSVEGCGEAGVVALLSSALRPGEWIAEPLRGTWLAEPLLLDGAFQMLVLWSSLRWNSPSLPTRVEAYEQYVSSFPAAGARAVARVTASTAHEATADIELLDAATGAMLARIGGYHCVIDASLAGAFRRNQLAQK